MDYSEIINLMLGNFSYNSIYFIPIEQDPNFTSKESRLAESINTATKQGARIKQKDQNGDKKNFNHIAVNRGFLEDGIKARIYLSPKQCNIHELVIQLVNNSLHAGTDIYFKYARTNQRLDQMIIYVKDHDDIEQKLELLKKIKHEKPELFEDMAKSKIWLNKTQIPNVFLEPEPLFLNIRGENSSYGTCFEKALQDTKTLLLYGYGTNEESDLIRYRQQDANFLNNFQTLFTEMLKRYGIYMKKNNTTNRYEIQGHPTGDNNCIGHTFYYNSTTKELVETRYGETQKVYRYPQNAKNKFFSNLIPEEQNPIPNSEPQGRENER